MPYGSNISLAKYAYLESGYISPYQLSGEDLHSIVEHYSKKGIQIYIENKVACDIETKQMALSQEVAVMEIMHIARGLREDEYAGYIYTNQAGNGRRHFEVFIISRDKIIKPVEWMVSVDKTLHRIRNTLDVQKCFTDLSLFNVHSIPQAGLLECGSLGISYLKNYLQDNARQIREYTLFIPCYIENSNDVEYFFFPSPDVLRYSQSSSYNKHIEGMLIADRDISLISHLQKVVSKAKRLKHLKVREEAEAILGILPDFTEKWLEHYQRVKLKRDQMQTKKHNLYLAYTSRRMCRIAMTAQQDTINPALELIREIRGMLSTSKHEEISVFLMEELAKISFMSVIEIGYFIKNIGEEFYIDVLKVFPTLNIKNENDFKDVSLFLNYTQIEILIEQILQVENFQHIVLAGKLNIDGVLNFLQALLIPVDETEFFFKKYFQPEWVTAGLKYDLLVGNLLKKIDHFPSLESFTRFLHDYIDLEWIKNLLKELFMKKQLSYIAPMFITVDEYQRFLLDNLDKEYIESSLLSITNLSLLWGVFIEYIRPFNGRNLSILFHTFSEELWLRLLYASVYDVIDLLHKCLALEELNRFLIKNSFTVISGILLSCSTEKLNSSTVLKDIIRNYGLEFLCSTEFTALIELYRDKLGVLLPSPDSQDISIFIRKNRLRFLEALIVLIPVNERLEFIQILFHTPLKITIPYLFSEEYIAKYFPMWIPSSSEDDEIQEQLASLSFNSLFDEQAKLHQLSPHLELGLFAVGEKLPIIKEEEEGDDESELHMRTPC